ncbi:sterol desaturase family protein [Sphingorhabdus sp. Alg239-R122]|uniref:sterol desaturase family protein n=1 Tax=Sphingorhabdus sp. Alg239-R122 TaxID=2305989 RepID=UPI0013DB27BD|nr:sterol desaturase family protein [Sphingorhabdus sp. Alg239-R122]
MKPEMLVILGIFMGFTLLEILRTGFFHKKGQRGKDAWVEIIGTVTLLGFTQPLVLGTAYFLMSHVFPGAEGSWAVLPIIAQVALLLVFDDLTQYGWHRLSHSVPWLYALHRPHHDAPYMSTRIVYRNNIFYYFLMPGIWFSGALIYLGLGWIYAFYIIVKMTVIIGAHSDVRWDEKLYEIKWLSPLMWVVERTISTPATHGAHHGRHAADGITNYKGNYGNLLFFWDVLFGTAKITRRYPLQYGVENLPEVSAAQQLLWPIVRTKKSPGPEETANIPAV